MVDLVDLVEVENKIQALTPRQRLVLEKVAETKNPKNAAAQLQITHRAVDYMLLRIYKVLGVSTLIGAVVFYVAYSVEKQVRHRLYSTQKEL